MKLKPRPSQAPILNYRGGPLAIPAVPGAGKTTSLVMLCETLIREGGFKPREILIVSYTRAGAHNIRSRVRQALAEAGIQTTGLKAVTIHGLCHDLVLRHRERLGLGPEVAILQENERNAILRGALAEFLHDPAQKEAYVAGMGGPEAFEDDTAWEKAMRASVDAAVAALALAKAQGRAPETLGARLRAAGLLELPPMISRYVGECQARRMIDYDDLLVLARRLFELEPGVLLALRRRFKVVLEDEAQDSTPGQHALIEAISAGHGNLVRVGDTNQSIYTTFTLNSPAYFRAFCAAVPTVTMDESSRSAARILALANRLVNEVAPAHPEAAIAEGTFMPLTIKQVEPAPRDHPRSVLFQVAEKKDDELAELADSVRAAHAWASAQAPERPTLAVLVPNRWLAEDVAKALARVGVPVARGAAGNFETRIGAICLKVLRFLALDVGSVRYREDLVAAFLDLHAFETGLSLAFDRRMKALEGALTAFLEPAPGTRGRDWRELLRTGDPGPAPAGVAAADWEAWGRFLAKAETILRLRHLPSVELATAIAELLFASPLALTVAQSLALRIKRLISARPDFRLPQIVAELSAGLNGGRFFPAIQAPPEAPEPAEGDEPPPLEVSLLTLHGSKGLEFDYVWLPFLNRREEFPWELSDPRATERRKLMVEGALAEGASDLTALARRASAEQVSERLRLLYVGLTRARRALRLSYVDSAFLRAKHPKLVPAPHVLALHTGALP